MHPVLFTLPGGYAIKTYGFLMMIGFLSAVWWAMRRAQRVKADPDIVLDLGFLSLLFGVGGARLFYVVHYWQTQFADAPNKLLAIIDVTKGGLEFLGGFLGAFAAIAVYAWLKNRTERKVSLRLYFDVLAPGAMWGLAFGRLGCFFNGCCFGGICLTPQAAEPQYAWAVEFPYGSAAFVRQWEDRRVTVPAELMFATYRATTPFPIPEQALHMPVKKREGPRRRYMELKKAVAEAKERGADDESFNQLEAELASARAAFEERGAELLGLYQAQRYPSRVNPSRGTSVSELEHLASAHRTLAVHPAQLYSSIHALLLSGVLAALFCVRKRHGVVIGALFVLYPIPRMLLEMIRADNPTDVGGLTISQSVSLLMVLGGAVWLFIVYKYLPERSPYAVAPLSEAEDSGER